MTKLFIPAQTDRDRGGILVSSDEMKLKNIGNHLCSTILSRYWKGIEGNSSQMVVEVRKCGR